MRHIVDMCMIVALPLLMAYELIGRATHEWLGMAMVALVIIHQILNRAWYKNIFRGRYNAARIATLIMDFGLVALMILQAVSGIAMARHVPNVLPDMMRRSVARTIHMTCAYWLFALMCVHAGFHMGAMFSRMKKRMKPAVFTGLRIGAWAIVVYGCYAFVKRQLPGYMFMQIRFAFFDYEEPLVFFFGDYLAIMALFLFIGYMLSNLLKRIQRKGKNTNETFAADDPSNHDVPDHGFC